MLLALALTLLAQTAPVSTVTVGWNPVTEDVAGNQIEVDDYLVYRAAPGGSWELVAIVPATLTKADLVLEEGITWSITVTAYKGPDWPNESAQATPIQVLVPVSVPGPVPAAPLNVQATVSQ